MSRAPKPAPHSDDKKTDTQSIDVKRLELQRIRVNSRGYDASGSYWGDGPDVFVARIARHNGTSPNRIDEVTVRARNVTEAREKIAQVLARAPGSKPAKREKLGGASAHSSRYEIDWRDPAADATVRIRITHARNYLGLGHDHVEIESIAPKKAPLPITETGYKSHFIDALGLINAGGPITFVAAWLDAEARSKAWQKQANARAQGDLFQWAAATKEVGKRASPKARRPDGTPSRQIKPRRRGDPDGSDPS